MTYTQQQNKSAVLAVTVYLVWWADNACHLSQLNTNSFLKTIHVRVSIHREDKLLFYRSGPGFLKTRHLKVLVASEQKTV